jgi:tRNA pseudouridine38-40 synthase
MAGIIIECGRGNMNSKDVEKFLEQYSDIPAKYTVPPSGLFLENVYYEQEPEQFDPRWPMNIYNV